MTVNYVSPKNKKIKTTKVQQQKNPTNNTSQINVNNYSWHIFHYLFHSLIEMAKEAECNQLMKLRFERVLPFAKKHFSVHQCIYETDELGVF